MKKFTLNILNVRKGKFKKKVRAIKDEKNWEKPSILRKREIKRNQIDTLNVNLGKRIRILLYIITV